ncbi:polyadenylate-binding protein-interacting protein 3-like isoform X2 [Apium graveolens]|uniref:polyadenylate-binding protein-interacting protein 3-like isoform X2 n=1 Tax=Apium graveolens TaxID=4045 RepID=UPI003D7A52C0
MPNVAHEAQASKPEYSHPSSRPKESFSDKVVLSPNPSAFDPTSSVGHENNALSDISENAASLKQHEITRSVNRRARPGSSTSSTSDCGNAVPVSTNTGLSPSSSAGSLASERSTLNPHAKEFKFNPNAKSFTPKKTSFRPASPVSDGSLYYSTNAPVAPNIHGMPVSNGMGQSFASYQPVMFNPRAAPMQSPQAYYYSNGPQVIHPFCIVSRLSPLMKPRQQPFTICFSMGSRCF